MFFSNSPYISKWDSTTDLISKFSSAKVLAFLDICFICFGFFRSFLISLLIKTGELIGTRTPEILFLIASLQPGWSVVIIGFPQAAASIIVLPNGSGLDDKVKTIADILYMLAMSFLAPQKVICDSRSFFLTSFF